MGWLRNQALSARRSPRQQKLVQDVVLTQGVELFKGQLVLRCEDPAHLSGCIVRLGQAMVRVADVWFTTRTRSVESISDEVADLLQEKLIPFERGVKLPGRSGRAWSVDFQTRTAERSSLVCVLSSGSQAAARRITEHIFTEWCDLSLLKTGALGQQRHVVGPAQLEMAGQGFDQRPRKGRPDTGYDRQRRLNVGQRRPGARFNRQCLSNPRIGFVEGPEFAQIGGRNAPRPLARKGRGQAVDQRLAIELRAVGAALFVFHDVGL